MARVKAGVSAGASIVNFFLGLQNTTKVYHWSTTSHARHVAADKLYDDINELTDRFVETYMGKYGRPKMPAKNRVEVEQHTDASIINYMKEACVYLSNELPAVLDVAVDSDLLNIRDEVLAKINQVLYLFSLT